MKSKFLKGVNITTFSVSISISNYTMSSLTSNLSCLNSVKRTTQTNSRPNVPSRAIVSASFDRSGSMCSMGAAPKEALLNFINDRKDDATKNNSEITVTLTTFDDRVEHLFENEPIENITLTEQEAVHFLEPRGTTRLIATAIEEVARLRKAFATLKTNNPNITVTALYLLFTDGFDNESHPLTARDLNAAIRAAEEDGITCIFAGADQDAISNGAQYGFSPNNSLTVNSAPMTAAAGFRSCSAAVSRAVSGGPIAFTQVERHTSQNVGSLTPPTIQPNRRLRTVAAIPTDAFNLAHDNNLMPPPLTRS